MFRRDARELRDALVNLRSLIGGNAHHVARGHITDGVEQSLARVNAAVERLESRGKTREVVAAIEHVYDTTPPLTVLGSGAAAFAELERREAVMRDDRPPEPVRGTGTRAQAQLAQQEADAELKREMNAADAYWKSALDGIRARFGVPVSARAAR